VGGTRTDNGSEQGVSFRADPHETRPSLLAHLQVEALGATVEIQHPIAGAFQPVKPFIRFSETPPEIRSPPLTLGQRTHEIMSALGLSDTEIGRLRKQSLPSVIFRKPPAAPDALMAIGPARHRVPGQYEGHARLV